MEVWTDGTLLPSCDRKPYGTKINKVESVHTRKNAKETRTNSSISVSKTTKAKNNCSKCNFLNLDGPFLLSLESPGYIHEFRWENLYNISLSYSLTHFIPLQMPQGKNIVAQNHDNVTRQQAKHFSVQFTPTSKNVTSNTQNLF